MKARALFLSLALWCAGAAVALAQSPHMGTWKLNDAKSKMPASAQKNSTVTYEAAGDDVKVTIEGTSADGQPTHTEWTGKFDGKDYPLTGDRNDDTRAYTLVNERTLSVEGKKDGKVTTHARIVVAPDGKTRTVTMRGMGADGKEVNATEVYDKQ